jgi:hypothetical protein
LWGCEPAYNSFGDPFDRGLIYSFATSSSPNLSFLLQLDSIYTTAGGDSAWAFNRLLRPFDGTALQGTYSPASCRKSRNNLFGARLICQTGTTDFVLECFAEGSYQAALALRLRPCAAIGSTWPASIAPALTATLTSRTWQPISNVPGSLSDSVVVITLSSGKEVRLSRQHGLLAGPRWLMALSSTAPQYEVAQVPVTFANSPVYPTAVFNMQPGDQFGYEATPRAVSSPPCNTTYTLRIIQTRQTVGDSLLYTYRQQGCTVRYAGVGCYAVASSVFGSPSLGRLAFSLRTGQSPQYPALPLLSGQYKALAPNSPASNLVVGLGIAYSTVNSCQAGNIVLSYQQMYAAGAAGNMPFYTTVTDGNWFQNFAPQTGVGDIRMDETLLSYCVRNIPSGTIVCGNPLNFATLLPARAAQAAAIATLHPNPATEAATLTLARPARPGHALRLTDALGRSVWSAPVPTGQTAILVPLAAQPPGLYLLHLSGPDATSPIWKLTHE